VKLSTTAAQLVFAENYETHYGIFDHNLPIAGPLSVVATHPTEEVLETGRLERYLDDYDTFKIYEWMTLDTFLQFAPNVVETIIKVRKAKRQLADAENKRLQDELKALESRGGG
jgi:hypothetical protein